MKTYLTEERRKELMEKRKYYREHPEEALIEYCKRDDGIGLVAVDEEAYFQDDKSHKQSRED